MVDTRQLMTALLDLGVGEHDAKAAIALLTKQGASLAELGQMPGQAPAQNGKTEKSREYIKLLRGLESIHQNYRSLVSAAEEEILVFVRPPYACDDLEKVSEQIHEYEAFLDRGGRLHWVFEVDSPGQAELVPAMVKPLNNRAKIRIAKKLPLKLMILDRQEVLVMHEDAMSLSKELTMTWMRHKAVAGAFRKLFMFFFDQSLDYATWKKEIMESQRVLFKSQKMEKSNREDGKRPMQTGF